LAAIGCNLAWGIIDAVMYVMNNITVRSLEIRLVHTIQDAPDKDAALNLIRNEIDPRLHSLLDPEESLGLSRSIHKRIAQMKVAKVRVTREDLYGAIACFWLVFVSFLSAAVPFLIFSERGECGACVDDRALRRVLSHQPARRFAPG
jgi:hypothetical protein